MSKAELEAKIKYIKEVIEKATFHVFTEEVYKEIDTENAQLKEVLREIIKESEQLIPKIEKVNYDNGSWLYIDNLEALLIKAKQLLNK